MTKKSFTFFALFIMGLLLTTTDAQADLAITPWRVVFQTRDRSASVQLLNLTDHTNTYRMGWMIMKATAEGKYEMVMKVDNKDPHSVANMVFFSPRQVTIEPHGQQVIRLSLRRPADLPPGEYRAHMTMTRLTKQETPQQDSNAKGIELALNVNLGFSIPIIVRQGEDRDLKISLSNPELKIQGKQTVLKLDINRDAGKFSSYGTIHIFWQMPKGKEQEVGTLTNIALYPELKTRHIAVPLTAKENITTGKIRVVYEGKYESEGKTWAEKTFPVGR
jgi:fimbrial chaperone protein